MATALKQPQTACPSGWVEFWITLFPVILTPLMRNKCALWYFCRMLVHLRSKIGLLLDLAFWMPWPLLLSIVKCKPKVPAAWVLPYCPICKAPMSWPAILHRHARISHQPTRNQLDTSDSPFQSAIVVSFNRFTHSFEELYSFTIQIHIT